jgi:hypothetical protein
VRVSVGVSWLEEIRATLARVEPRRCFALLYSFNHQVWMCFEVERAAHGEAV